MPEGRFRSFLESLPAAPSAPQFVPDVEKSLARLSVEERELLEPHRDLLDDMLAFHLALPELDAATRRAAYGYLGNLSGVQGNEIISSIAEQMEEASQKRSSRDQTDRPWRLEELVHVLSNGTSPELRGSDVGRLDTASVLKRAFTEADFCRMNYVRTWMTTWRKWFL